MESTRNVLLATRRGRLKPRGQRATCHRHPSTEKSRAPKNLGWGLLIPNSSHSSSHAVKRGLFKKFNQKRFPKLHKQDPTSLDILSMTKFSYCPAPARTRLLKSLQITFYAPFPDLHLQQKANWTINHKRNPSPGWVCPLSFHLQIKKWVYFYLVVILKEDHKTPPNL